MEAVPKAPLALLACSLLVAAAHAAPPQGGGFAFVEPEGEAAAGELPLFRRVTDRTRLAALARWVDSDAGRWALDVYRRARAVAERREEGVQPREYFVALEAGGASAGVGFRLRTAGGVEAHPRAAYARLGEEAWRFVPTLVHETGHVALAVLAGGREIPRRPIAPLPHALTTLTDRGTAFDEGFATHLETVLAHVSAAPEVRSFYRHERFLFGPAAGPGGAYFRRSAGPLSLAETQARYGAVRDNDFAFVAAFKGPDYVRAQLDPARDFATLRDADQLLQSEGFYATFFFSLLVRGGEPATGEVVRQRQDAVLVVLSQMFATRAPDPEAPFLVEFVATYRRVFPDDAGQVLDVFLDLTRGVFVAPDAAALWRDHYLAALGPDGARANRDRIDAARSAWRAAAVADPGVLSSRLGPQLRCSVAGRSVSFAGAEAPLTLDVNTAEEGVVRLVPGITDAEVASWLGERARRPFADVADFRARSGLSGKILTALQF